MKPVSFFRRAALTLVAALAICPGEASAQPSLDLDTPDFALRLTGSSQTVAALRPKGAGSFDFTPADWLERRSGDGFHHLGDLVLRVRRQGDAAWLRCDTAAARRPVAALPAAGPVLAAADLAPSLPAGCPVQVTRSWTLTDAGRLALRFEIRNPGARPVEIGALSIPMVFNNLITGRSLEQAHETCSFADPYIGLDAGYLQVTRLNGRGPVLVVVPEERTPFEAYQPLDEPMRREQTFEGMLAWTVHSRAYAEADWHDARPWNPPTSATLAPGESRVYGVRFLLAPEVRRIEQTLADNGRPVAVGVPGYILPADQEGRLFLHSPRKVRSVAAEPAGSIDVQEDPPAPNGWPAYTLRARGWGRARLLVTYEDGAQQAVSYTLTKPAAEAVRDLGHFLFTWQWFVEPGDPFGRSPSVIGYDREKDRQTTQESRVWIAGLGDEGGSGSWLAAVMKESGQPDAQEVAKCEAFIDGVLWGGLQHDDGPHRYGVRKSLFYHDPKALPGFEYDRAIDWRSWTSWNKAATEDLGRGYNYPHVVAAYWAMYRVARNHPEMTRAHPWQWYLDQAYRTTSFMFGRDADGERRVGYVELGLMEGTVFRLLLEDLRREGRAAQAADVEALMRERADRWKGERYPFGSEMAWDSTGQEEVYCWCDYFGFRDQARVTLDAILGYMPTVPHWGYNGNARRYWDFLYGGKLPRIERQLHHYGSGLNALPVLTEFRSHPDDLYLLRVGYGGAMGALAGIDREGFASAAFHSYPQTLRWDAYAGDYGPNFFGHATSAATYVVEDPGLGWQAFGGNVRREGDWVKVAPRDSFRARVYLAPRGLWLTLDAGQFEAVELNARTGAVRVALADPAHTLPRARLRVEQPARVAGVGTYRPAAELATEAGAYSVELGPDPVWVELHD